jgi:hypothetical protein
MKAKISAVILSTSFIISPSFADNGLSNAIIAGTVNSMVATSSMMIMQKNGIHSHIELTPYGAVAVTDNKNHSQAQSTYQAPTPEELQDQKIDFMND